MVKWGPSIVGKIEIESERFSQLIAVGKHDDELTPVDNRHLKMLRCKTIAKTVLRSIWLLEFKLPGTSTFVLSNMGHDSTQQSWFVKKCRFSNLQV